MCGIVGIAGSNIQPQTLEAMLAMQHHRGPDNTSVFITDDRHCGFGHNRLSIIDLSPEANQPRHDDTGRYSMVFNGEIYNYLEIRNELKNDFHFKTNGDSEVLLCAYKKWGADCLHKLIGMFSIAIWDKDEKTLFAARDRFGVKPFNYAVDADKNFYFSSEIKALFAAGIPKITNEKAWAEYLALGRYDHDENTFWQGIKKLPAGSFMIWKGGDFTIKQWYFLEKETGTEFSTKSIEEVTANYFELLKHTIRLRFRADVPVGINLSGGLDSSALLAMVNAAQGEDNDVKAFTFITGDDQYDELKWVEEMINKTHHPLVPCLLRADEVPALAEKVQYHQDEPFGGMPTLAYSKIFETARQMGVIVLLDGQGMDEQWAGYDYYRKANTTLNTPTVQGTNSNAVLMDTLQPNFTEMVGDFVFPEKYPDLLRNLQYRDSFYTKIPRALRFNDRVSMMSSTELREPFLDHRLFEVAFQQPADFKIKNDSGKYFMRRLLNTMLPGSVVEAPKRALQTPQREWLRTSLKGWAEMHISNALSQHKNDWLNETEVWKSWKEFLDEKSDNSFYIWQWISISLMGV